MSDTLQSKMQTSKLLREKLTLWDAKNDPKAQLSDKQKDSFMELTTHSTNRPLPIELPLDDVPVFRTRHTSVNLGPGEEEELVKQLEEEKITNSQQFFTWFSEVEDQIQSQEGYPQRKMVGELQTCRCECDHVIDEVTQALNHLETLKVKYVQVATKTNALHEDCENLLEEQTKLVNIAENINSKLSYFNELERISSKLGVPTLTVTNESFVPMLSRLDECIAYLERNPQYKESSNYLAKFHQCLSRATTLIKLHVMNILQNATQQVLPKKDFPAPSDDAFTLFYGKFRTNAPRIKSLMEQVECRLEKSPEYQQLLTDCHQCYFQQRMALLSPSVSGAVMDLAKKHVRDHCALVRSGCAFMVHVCEDEHQLFFNFFSKPTSLLDSTLEALCTSLYDVLRPLIIHINHLETLAELCSILKIEMLEEHVQNNPSQLAAFETVCSQMLEDVQERFVYRTLIYIRQEILNYNPAQGDLAYPEKLQMMQQIAASVKREQEEKREMSPVSSQSSDGINIDGLTSIENGISDKTDARMDPNVTFINVPLESTNMPLSPADLHGMWYPTVRRTLVCLSKLYRCIDRNTFQGLSQETLSMCIQSLVNASESIAKNKGAMDAQLFLIKHLLILREQIAPFQVEFAIKEMTLDFSKIRGKLLRFVGAAVDLLKARTKLFALEHQQCLVTGTPQVTETFLDSKKEVDNQLKRTCEDFIHYISDYLVGPLQDFLNKASVVLHMMEEDNSNVSLRSQPFATAEKLHDVIAETYKNLKNRKPIVQKSMALYLSNKDTEYILFKPVKCNVQQSFQQLHILLSEHYTEEDQQIIAAPTLEQINLLLASSSCK
ncbi:hypothetical protein LSH36_325g04065 [Paralvinella palmiformis]|uniref:Conserved oligomeric Golgi complex subunit 3 n=1 Tax=Paralvinella palmiformis TaxID=53620 RepID=A0AAD9JG85_9ANNE|nr:hypothetical protein LSH36_325g04065 [Paralvinella palmiformis]